MFSAFWILIWNIFLIYTVGFPNFSEDRNIFKANFLTKLCAYRKFTLDALGVKMTNYDFSHGGNMRDVPFENYIHKLKFPIMTTNKGYNTKYIHGEKS